MIKNFLRVAIRNILKDKFYTLINVFGLALGVASCIFIIIYINDELSYDRFNHQPEQTYRVIEFIDTEGSGERSSSAPFPVGPTLVEDYGTMIKTQVRFFNFQSPTILMSVEENEKEFSEPGVLFVDSTFFDVFNYEMVQGDQETALNNPNSVLITEAMAEKYFGEEDAIGKLIKVEDQVELIVTGIMKESKKNAHFQFDFLVSFSTLRNFFGGRYPPTWYWNPCWTYIVLNDGVSPGELESVFPDFITKYFPEQIKEEARMALQPLTDIHLTSDLEFEIQPNSSESNIYVFTVIGIFILVIAGMNFMNLSTARSAKRAKEVGLRKTLGGFRSQLIAQFLIESFIVSLIGILLAVGLALLALPSFNLLAEKVIPYGIFLEPFLIIALVCILIVIGLGSGIYPALVLSSYVPVKVLKDSQPKGGRGAFLRKLLVVVQFSLSIVMIIGTVIALNQLEFLRKSSTGFDREQILYVSALRTPVTQSYPTLKKELEAQSDIESVTGVLDVLGANHQGDNFRFAGMEKSLLYSVMWVNHDFFKTFGMEIVAGRTFKENITTDDSLAVLVNEAMVRQHGWGSNEEALGKSYENNGFTGEIVGVVKDFNFVSKHKGIQPLIIQLRSNPVNFNFSLKYVALKLNTTNLPQTLTFIEGQWKKLVPGRPFDYFFLDQELDKLYKDEEKLSKVAGIFSGLAIIVACLGLFALASFMAEERRKEIGIRKVMGGSSSQIVMLLSKDFAKLILISFIIACPLAWFAIDSWLNNFAFKVEINSLVFVAVGFATLVIALLTISYRALQAAATDPVKTMKHE